MAQLRPIMMTVTYPSVLSIDKWPFLTVVAISALSIYSPVLAQHTTQSAAAEHSADSTERAKPVDDKIDIIVTARKRAESAQDIPLSFTAISDTIVRNRRVMEISDIPSVTPSVTVSLGSGQNRIFIRGIGLRSPALGADSSVAFHVDGVAIGRPSAQLSSFFDVDRIEVLNGPQGTLYGRNASGGSINVISKKPTSTVEGYIRATYGNYDLIQTDAAIGGPLNAGGAVQARIAVQSIDHDGYGRNVTLGEDIDDTDRKAVRASLYFEPTAKFNFLLMAEYAGEHDHNYAIHSFGGYTAATPLAGVALGGMTLPYSRNIAADRRTRNDRTSWGINATANLELSNNISLRSITGYRSFKRINQLDPDLTSFRFSGFRGFEKSRLLSEELQILYNANKLNGIFGLFYYHENLEGNITIPFFHFENVLSIPGATFIQEGAVPIKAYAAFTEFTYELFPRFRFTAGLRVSHERRSLDGTFTVFSPALRANVTTPTISSASWNAWTPKFGLDYSPFDDVMLYASATKGFKSGVINVGSTNPPVNPEHIWAYEAGIKSRILDRRLTANIAAFLYDFTNLQINRAQGNTNITVNAPGAKIKGIDLAFDARPSDILSIQANISYLDTRFSDFLTQNPSNLALGVLNLAGNRLPQAPRWSISAGGELVIPLDIDGKLSIRGDVSRRSFVYFTEFNNANVAQKAYSIFDASLQYTPADGKWDARIWAKNLTNKLVPSGFDVGSSLFGFTLNGSLLPPRTYGVTLGYNF